MGRYKSLMISIPFIFTGLLISTLFITRGLASFGTAADINIIISSLSAGTIGAIPSLYNSNNNNKRESLANNTLTILLFSFLAYVILYFLILDFRMSL